MNAFTLHWTPAHPADSRAILPRQEIATVKNVNVEDLVAAIPIRAVEQERNVLN